MRIWRVVEHQAKIYEYNATSTDERADALRRLIEDTKPRHYESKWHDLIASQFRYNVPVPAEKAARFRPAGFMRNIFYASQFEETALYEHAYHYFRFRKNLKRLKRTGQRTLFAAFLVQNAQITDVTTHTNVSQLTDPYDWIPSQLFVRKNPKVRVIKYPSCRDPRRRPNYAILDINQLEKSGEERVISYSHNLKAKTLHWKEFDLTIKEDELLPAALKKKPKKSAKKF